MTRMLHAPGHAGRGTTCRRLSPTRMCSAPGPAGLWRRSAILHLIQEWQAGRCGILTRILVGAVRTCRSRWAGRAQRIPDPERTIRSYGPGSGPREPGSLYTVRRDLHGHGGPDVMRAT
jgi:hypothetical protein